MQCLNEIRKKLGLLNQWITPKEHPNCNTFLKLLNPVLFPFLFTLKNHRHHNPPTHPPPSSTAFLLACAEGRWQKELCKRAFKIPKWLWSAHNEPKNTTLDKGRPLPHHSALQWWIRTDTWTWAGFEAVEAPPQPPHWANQKGQATGIHSNPSQGPPNNHDLLTSFAIPWPWLIWETHACSSIQKPSITLYYLQKPKIISLLEACFTNQAWAAIKNWFYKHNSFIFAVYSRSRSIQRTSWGRMLQQITWKKLKVMLNLENKGVENL